MITEYEPGQRPARENELKMMVEANSFPPITKGKPLLTLIIFIVGLLIATFVVIGSGNWFAIQFGDMSAMMFAILVYALFFFLLFRWSRRQYWKRVENLKKNGVMIKETVLSKDEVKEYSAKKVHMLQYPIIINEHAGRCLLVTCGDKKKYLPYFEDWQKAQSESYTPSPL